MRINFCDNVPLDDGILAYGTTATGETYVVHCTESNLTLFPIDKQVLLTQLELQKARLNHGIPTDRKT